MPERDMNPQTPNGRRYRIDADTDKGETAIDIVLPVDLPKGRQTSDYRIVKKDIPDLAKTKTFRNKSVLWINNFGIRLKGNFRDKNGSNKDDPFTDEVAGEQFSYEVIVPGPAPAGYLTLVYFDGTDVQAAQTTTDSSGNFHFNLNIGDPAAGWGG